VAGSFESVLGGGAHTGSFAELRMRKHGWGVEWPLESRNLRHSAVRQNAATSERRGLKHRATTEGAASLRLYGIRNPSLLADRKRPRGDRSPRGDRREKIWGSGVDRGFDGGDVVAMLRAFRHGVQALALLGREEGEDLLVRGVVELLLLGTAGGLRLGQLGDLGLLFARELEGFDELKGFFKVVHRAGGVRAADRELRVSRRDGRGGARGRRGGFEIGRGDGAGFLR